MKQVNQIGKYTKKDDVLMAKAGRTFVTPNNKEYIFDFFKEGRKYIFVINYLGYKMRISESDFNRTNIDDLLCSIEKSIQVN
jgi:hypothetical protein